ncbi:MAG: DUF885 domain-containing protein [Candidatus Aminicenantes bacterium]|nr:DUF885 domain-containing protein [Candidatus Aminicenantes bacterium]
MKKRAVPMILFIFAFSFLGLSFLRSSQNQEETKFQKTMDNYLDAYWKFYPTAATMAGYHKYDDKLEDLSDKSIEKHHDNLDAFSQELVAKTDKTKLGADSQIEYDIMRNAIDLELMRHENLLPWQYNPIFYNQLFLNSLRSLLTVEFAPLDVRMKSAVERAKSLPDLIKKAKENLQTPPEIYTQTAIRQFAGIIHFYRTDVPKLIEAASPDMKSKFQAEWAKIIPALEDYQSYLQTQLLPKSTGNFRLGEQAHSRLLTLTGEFSIPGAELVARARADYNNIRREMAIVAMPFYRIMYPNISMEQLSTQYNEEQLRNIFIKGVFDKIKGEHPTKENFVEGVKGSADNIKSFFSAKGLIALPDADLVIEPMPAAEQGISWTRLLTPVPYATAGSYSVLVSPIPEGLSADQVESLLEEYNDYYSPWWTVRQVFPGWFVPTFFTQKSGSLLTKIHPNMPLIKGWPVILEEMMINDGFGNYDLRLRLNQLKSQLKVVMDFNLELNIHQGGMTKEQAIQYMTAGGFQTPAEAEWKWNRILLAPCESAYPYIGYQEILDMEKDYRKTKGDAYSKKEFLQELLNHGAIPIRFLKAKLAAQ